MPLPFSLPPREPKDVPQSRPRAEQDIVVIHEPQRRVRRAIFVMFLTIGILVFLDYRESEDNSRQLDAAQKLATEAVSQNAELQRTLDELVEAEKADDETQRIRSERSAAFIAAVLANSSDPVLRAAAEQALSDVAGTPADPRPSASSGPPSPSSAPAPEPRPQEQPQPDPEPSPSAPPSSPSPSPSPTPLLCVLGPQPIGRICTPQTG